jgi:formylglycine-generating enzyme required for sulfatase activity
VPDFDGRTVPRGAELNCERVGYSGCSKDIVGIGRHDSGVRLFGIHAMAGNAWAWVADWYSESDYRNSPASNSLGPDEEAHRLMRGGTWDSPAENLHTYNRLKYKPAFFTEDISFRCARDAEP